MTDKFQGNQPGLESPATVAEAVDISSTDYTPANDTRAIFIGTGGNIKLDMIDGSTPITFTNIQDGAVLPFRVNKIYATGTTASNMTAVW